MAKFTPTSSRAFSRRCLTGNDVLKLLEDKSFEAEFSYDSDKSDDSICDVSDPEDGWRIQ